MAVSFFFFFFSSRRRHTRFSRDWSSDVCSSDLGARPAAMERRGREGRGDGYSDGHRLIVIPAKTARKLWRQHFERGDVAHAGARRAGGAARSRTRGALGAGSRTFGPLAAFVDHHPVHAGIAPFDRDLAHGIGLE